MQISFYTRGRSDIAKVYMRVTYNCQDIKLNTNLVTNVVSWNKRRGLSNVDIKLNKQLDMIRNSVIELYNRLSEDKEFNSDTFKSALKELICNNDKDNTLVKPFYKEWATTTIGSHKPTRQLLLAYNNFDKYAKDNITFKDITTKFINGFISDMYGKNWSLNYIGNQLKNLKAMMNFAYKLGLHDNTAYQNFKKMYEDADSIYLTQDEITRIQDVELQFADERKARDLFLIGYYTAMRFSDYSRLSINDIDNGKIRLRTQKTGEVVVIPAHRKVLDILNEYGGKAPTITMQKFNTYIKIVCQKAKIDSIQSVSKTIGNKKEVVYAPKYQLVSSHTARRSGATNMYLNGIDLHSICLITGHTSVTTLRKYLRISKEENANRLSDNPFFRL